MAKKNTSGRKQKTPKVAKQEPTMTPRQAFSGFNPKGRTSWQDYTRSPAVMKGLGRRLGINETGLAIDPTGTQKEVIASIDKHLDAFADSSGRWEATAAYGRQHFNDDGFLHSTGLTRLDDDALAKLAAQALEQLAQRAAFASTAATGRKTDSKNAAALIDGICVWVQQRPKAIFENKKKQDYEIVKSDIQGEAPTLELKA